MNSVRQPPPVCEFYSQNSVFFFIDGFPNWLTDYYTLWGSLNSLLTIIVTNHELSIRNKGVYLRITKSRYINAGTLGLSWDNLSPPHPLVTIINSARVAIVQKSSIALHQGDGELLEEVLDGGRLLLPSVAREGTAKLLHLSDGRLVPSTFDYWKVLFKHIWLLKSAFQ